jgi:hypothetical protein
MNRLPNGQVDAHYSPSLGRISVTGNGHIEAVPSAVRRDESASPQEGLQVVKEPWSVDEDVHAAIGRSRRCRKGDAFSHCRQKADRVKGMFGDHQAGANSRGLKGGRVVASGSSWPERPRTSRLASYRGAETQGVSQRHVPPTPASPVRFDFGHSGQVMMVTRG